jgi:hypothetical protein
MAPPKVISRDQNRRVEPPTQWAKRDSRVRRSAAAGTNEPTSVAAIIFNVRNVDAWK